MKLRHAILFFALVLVKAPVCSARSSLPLYFETLLVEDGLSQISVLAIHQDRQGYMWFGTRDGLNKYNGYEFEVFLHDTRDPVSISDNYIKCITEDRDGMLWIGTTNGLNRYNPRTGTFSRYYIHPRRSIGNYNEINAILYDKESDKLWISTYYGLFFYDPVADRLEAIESISERTLGLFLVDRRLYIGMLKGLAVYDPFTGQVEYYSPFSSLEPTSTRNGIKTIFQDSRNRVWLGSSYKGLARLDPESMEIVEVIDPKDESKSKTRHHEIRDIREDRDGNLIVGTYDGVWVYSPENKTLHAYNQSESGRGGLSDYSVESVCVDKDNTVWVGTYSGGINFSNQHGGRFRFYNPSENHHILGVITMMAQDKDRIWMGTEGGGLIEFDPEALSFAYYPCSIGVGDSYKDNNIKCILIDGNRLYVGVYVGYLYIFDIKQRKYIAKIPNTGGGAIYSICKNESTKELLLGTYSSLGLQMLENDILEPYHLPTSGGQTTNVPKISALLTDGDNMYIGTRDNGLYLHAEGNLKHYSTESGDERMTGNKITVIKRDCRDNILIGTSDGGLNIFDPLSRKFSSVLWNDGLKDNNVCSIVEDNKNRLWVITRTGISELDTAYRVTRSYGHSSGIHIQEFSIGSALARDNTIWIGGNNGFISFSPDNLSENTRIPPIVIHSILVNNEPVKINENASITLRHDQANLSIKYGALNYIYPEQNQYAYKLEGMDHDWNHVGNSRAVNYANLAPGHYTFRVKGSNNDGLWNETGASLKIIIHPPFWLTRSAWIIYVIAFISITSVITRYYRTQQNLRKQVIIKQKEEELYKARIDLFTNFSHELRTPLTLIEGPVEDALMSNNPHKINSQILRMIHGNTRRLLLLVDQLMTFRKQESGSLKLKVAEGDFAGFAREMEIAFGELARLKQIDLSFVIRSMPSSVWYDRNMFEKVLMNLLSNAFKHTPDRGKISLQLSKLGKQELPPLPAHFSDNLYRNANEYLQILVEDNGSGVNPGDLAKIFDPFFQSSKTEGGTGIGLSLSKGIVELHHGCIWAENVPDGGTRFTILVPAGNEHFSREEIITDYHDSEDVARYKNLNVKEETLESDPSPTKRSDHTILIVEDNDELRRYMKSCLRPYYRVIEAANGKEGKMQAIATMPTLILSDIMMPVMDGLQMCRDLKKDLRTSHIPVILLTARAFVLQMKEGLEFGADDYITKPFNIALLLLKMKNIIASRENLKNLYAKRLSLENMGVEINSSDEKFLQKLNEVVERNITDPTLDIERFCEEIGMSRASLYRKLMATTNMSPSRYIQSVRLHLAAKMLRETDMSISDISDTVGFNSLIHFSATFRKQYGVSPSKFENRDKSSKSIDSPGTPSNPIE